MAKTKAKKGEGKAKKKTEKPDKKKQTDLTSAKNAEKKTDEKSKAPLVEHD